MQLIRKFSVAVCLFLYVSFQVSFCEAFETNIVSFERQLMKKFFYKNENEFNEIVKTLIEKRGKRWIELHFGFTHKDDITIRTETSFKNSAAQDLAGYQEVQAFYQKLYEKQNLFRDDLKINYVWNEDNLDRVEFTFTRDDSKNNDYYYEKIYYVTRDYPSRPWTETYTYANFDIEEELSPHWYYVK